MNYPGTKESTIRDEVCFHGTSSLSSVTELEGIKNERQSHANITGEFTVTDLYILTIPNCQPTL